MAALTFSRAAPAVLGALLALIAAAQIFLLFAALGEAGDDITLPPMSAIETVGTDAAAVIGDMPDTSGGGDKLGALAEAFADTAPWDIARVLDRCDTIFPAAPFPSLSTQPPLTTLVYHGLLADYSTKAQSGNTMGELLYWKEILFAMCALNANHRFVTSRDEMVAILAAQPQSYDIVLTDGYSYGTIKEFVQDRSLLCKLRVLDDWGTPASQNHDKLDLTQYLVPWTCARSVEQDRALLDATVPLSANGNFLLGHFLLPAVAASEKKAFQGLVWGKEPQYYSNPVIRSMLEAVSQRVPLVVTAKPAANQHLPQTPNITNLGIVSQAQRESLLSQSLFLIGLGDPVVGLTPFEALSHGAVYVNPHYPQPKSFWMNSQCPYHSQHPAADKMAEPLVYHYTLTMDQRMTASVVEIVNALIERYHRDDEFSHYIDPFMTFQAFTQRLDHILRKNVCQR